MTVNTANLVSYWKMDEASGARVDVHGSHDLTDNNTVGSNTGILNNAASFVAANSEWLSAADHAELDFAGSFSLSLWFLPNTLSTNYQNLLYKGTDGSTGRNYGIAHSAGGASKFWLQIRGVVGLTDEITSSEAPVEDQWNHAVVTYDQSTRVRKLYINGVEGHSEAGTAGSPTVNTAELLIANGTGGFAYHDGLIDEVGLWDGHVLTTTEIAELYNSGDGLAYEDFEGGGGQTVPVGLAAIQFGHIHGSEHACGAGLHQIEVGINA